MKLAILLILCAAIACQAWNPNLQYIGYYTYNDTDYLHLSSLANLYEHTDLDVLQAAYSKAGLLGLWYVQYIFFTNFQLRPDYISSWQQAAKQVAPLLHNGTSGPILGFMMGDELINNGVSYDSLNTSINLIRETFPDAIIYTNEAFNTFPSGGYPEVPPNLDWISMDMYAPWGNFGDAQAMFVQHVFPKMASHQKALIVTPLYSTTVNPSYYCGNSHCEQAMIQWNLQALLFAQQDERFVGFFSWHYDTFSASSLPGWEIGLESLPYLTLAVEHIASQIKTGKPNPPTPSFTGSICGWAAGEGSTANSPCNGVDTQKSCPEGYTRNTWSIGNTGDGIMSFCVAQSETDSVPDGAICGLNVGGDIIPCGGYDPAASCPEGFARNEWAVAWGTQKQFFCAKINSTLEDPTGTICGMVTNGGSTGAQCAEYNPSVQCPTGYAKAQYAVNFGDGTWSMCFKI